MLLISPEKGTPNHLLAYITTIIKKKFWKVKTFQLLITLKMAKQKKIFLIIENLRLYSIRVTVCCTLCTLFHLHECMYTHTAYVKEALINAFHAPVMKKAKAVMEELQRHAEDER